MSDTPTDDTLAPDGTLAGAEAGDDELGRPVDVPPVDPTAESDDDLGEGGD